MPGGGQESATNLSAYRYLQNTVDDMSGWGWFSLCGVGDFVKNWWTQKYCQIPSLKCLITNVTMMIPNIMPIYSKYLDREKTNKQTVTLTGHAIWQWPQGREQIYNWLAEKKRKNQAVPMDQPKPDPTEMFRINKCLQTLMNNIIKKGPTFVHNNDRDCKTKTFYGQL